jgi:hypothetical protein
MKKIVIDADELLAHMPQLAERIIGQSQAVHGPQSEEYLLRYMHVACSTLVAMLSVHVPGR